MMKETDRDLLESILVAEVLLLSREIDRERCKHGVTKIGGDYTHEAITLIRQKRPTVLQALRAPH